MMKLFALFVSSVVVTADPLRSNLDLKNSARIVGGNNAVIEDFPYQVNFLLDKLDECGGAIILEKWVLTSEQYLNIRVGSNLKNKGGSLHTVVQVIRHEDYKLFKNGYTINDIALVEVETLFVFDKTRQPVLLFDKGEQVEVNSFGSVAGFGLTESEIYPQNLSSISIPIMLKNKCDELYDSLHGLHQGQFCAGYEEGGLGFCAGDIGSPFVVNGRAAGLATNFSGCGLPKYPRIFTNISYYRSWIDGKLSTE
ncbi:LOW QUALITY PROTEIN: trypsin-6-like [Cotesia typhae]|uniref:LOW QUALITY PROTEIN: trypsin-6-like n=1 Tax=Cotesia typhae TaxID=2053667 RepID=UPI003D699412